MEGESPKENFEDVLIILKEVEQDSDTEEDPKKPLNNKVGTSLHKKELKLKIIKYAKSIQEKNLTINFPFLNQQ